MTAVVVTGSRCDLGIEVHYRNQPNKNKLSLYKLALSFNSCLNSCTYATRWNTSVIKLDVVCIGDICVSCV